MIEKNIDSERNRTLKTGVLSMSFITVDLGTTNIKVTAFTDDLREAASTSVKVIYASQGKWIEFDPEAYFSGILNSIGRMVPQLREPVRQIVLTGQAESLVLLDNKARVLRAGISWLDTRSDQECDRIKQAFPEDAAFLVTGQPANTPTWPITKILWLKEHEPDIFGQVDKFVLLKDYIQYRLSGILLGEYSIYNFSYYFDIRKKDYWQDLLDWCGIRRSQLPDLVEPCTTVGLISAAIARETGLPVTAKVNIGTLDHFAGMIGTGNIRPGIISESTGTVLSLATLLDRPILSEDPRIACHYGPFKDSYVLLPVCESGGISLEWFQNNLAEMLTYQELDKRVADKRRPGDLVFLPYLTGTNSPDFNADAKGVLYGLKLVHDRIDCALAVMEGVAYLLHRNLASLERMGVRAERVITTGGGSKSDIWCQIKADQTGYEFAVPKQTEAASLGCALIGAVASGVYDGYQQGIDASVAWKKTFTPGNTAPYQALNRLYDTLYQQLGPVFALDAARDK